MDVVTITCYGKTEKMERAAAKRFYSEAMLGCDPGSSEYGRYARIFYQLTEGMKEVSDEE